MRENFGGFTLEIQERRLTVHDNLGEVTVPFADIKSVTTSEGLLGSILTVETYGSPLYIKDTNEAITKAHEYITELVR